MSDTWVWPYHRPPDRLRHAGYFRNEVQGEMEASDSCEAPAQGGGEDVSGQRLHLRLAGAGPS